MSQRALMPDYLRLIALFGIVVVNVQGIAFSTLEGTLSATHKSSFDIAILWLVDTLFYIKTYSLFSFMFGVGLAFQMQAAQRRDLPFGKTYRNRIFGLILLGIAHACLFFPGDILIIYGIMGSLLYLMRNWSVEKLVRTGAILVGLFAIIAAGLMWITPPEDPSMNELLTAEAQILRHGSWGEVISLRSVTSLILVPILVIFQGFSALGWFALGLAAVKSGMIDQPDHPLWARARRSCLLLGLIASAIAAYHLHYGNWNIGSAALFLIAPISTLGYLGLIAKIARPPGPVMARLLSAGGSSLTLYLGQSILLSTIFAPYGLNLWDKVGPATAILIAILSTLLLIGFVLMWRKRFAMGPFEWILRRITYAGTQR